MCRLALLTLALALVFPALSFAQEGSSPTHAPPADDLDLNGIAEMLANTPPQSGNVVAPTVNDRASIGTSDSVTDVMRTHIMQCWRPPDPADTRTSVTVAFELNRDGSLAGEPRVTSPRRHVFDQRTRIAAEAAREAVRSCAPYPFAADPTLSNQYELWNEFELVFRAY